jgi:hypothetical protein
MLQHTLQRHAISVHATDCLLLPALLSIRVQLYCTHERQVRRQDRSRNREKESREEEQREMAHWRSLCVCVCVCRVASAAPLVPHLLAQARARLQSRCLSGLPFSALRATGVGNLAAVRRHSALQHDKRFPTHDGPSQRSVESDSLLRSAAIASKAALRCCPPSRSCYPLPAPRRRLVSTALRQRCPASAAAFPVAPSAPPATPSRARSSAASAKCATRIRAGRPSACLAHSPHCRPAAKQGAAPKSY